jgi:hypothetical protein
MTANAKKYVRSLFFFKLIFYFLDHCPVHRCYHRVECLVSKSSAIAKFRSCLCYSTLLYANCKLQLETVLYIFFRQLSAKFGFVPYKNRRLTNVFWI